MILLEKISIAGHQNKSIELYQGDLTSLNPDEAVDLLVISAFPNDYLPTPSSLIGALSRKGLSVTELAKEKDQDLRQYFSCWLSKKFVSPSPGLRFNRILCFEPLVRGNPPEVVGDIFRSLAPIMGDKNNNIQSVAMPLVAAGDQGYSPSDMLTPLLDAAIHWMESGLPLNQLKIAVYNKNSANEATAIFSAIKEKYETSIPISKPDKKDFKYDIFLSYAHENIEHARLIEKELTRQMPNIKIFIERKDINMGSAWQPEIFENLDNCRKVVVVFSPQYLLSKPCKEEFNIAWVRSRENDEDIIFPIYLYSAMLPTYMKYRSYIDCREGDKKKLHAACENLVSYLRTAQGKRSTPEDYSHINVNIRRNGETKILFLGANPEDTARLRLDEEIKRIQTDLKLAKERDNLELKQEWAVTVDTLLQAILDESPNIVHFSGHGEQDGILLQNESGEVKTITTEALTSLFKLFKDTVKCVVLNACYSENQAKAIKAYIPYVIGMKASIPDKAAISFSTGFYKAIGAGRDIPFAFELGITAMRLEGVSGDNIPVLLS